MAPGDAALLARASALAADRAAHDLQADPPTWLTGWLGDRPTAQVGALLWDDVVAKVSSAPPLAWACVVFAGVVSTIGASALLFWLVQRREPGRVTPYFLLTPLVSCTIGVLFMGDALSPQLVIGGGATMVGVALVALTEKKTPPATGGDPA